MNQKVARQLEMDIAAGLVFARVIGNGLKCWNLQYLTLKVSLWWDSYGNIRKYWKMCRNLTKLERVFLDEIGIINELIKFCLGLPSIF